MAESDVAVPLLVLFTNAVLVVTATDRVAGDGGKPTLPSDGDGVSVSAQPTSASTGMSTAIATTISDFDVE